jgi:hypothetical protein
MTAPSAWTTRKRRGGAEDRGEGEKDEPGQIDAFLTDDVTPPADPEGEAGQGEEIGDRDPLDDGESGFEVGPDGGEGDIDDRTVDGGEEDPHPDGRHGMPFAAVVGRTVGWRQHHVLL